MSCIPRILELKGDKEILPIPSKQTQTMMRGVVVEDGGHYRGFDFLITFNDMGFRCGYVALPPDHKANECEEDYPSEWLVHGGITFFGENHLSNAFFGENSCKDKWLGFDCGHAGDLFDLDTAQKYFSDNERIMNRIRRLIEVRNEVEELMEKENPGYKSFKYSDENELRDELRTKEYAINQCKLLIDQLIEANKSEQ